MNIKFNKSSSEKKVKSEPKSESKSSCVLITETVGVESSKGDSTVKRGRGRPCKNVTPESAKGKRGRKPNALKELLDEVDDDHGDDGGDKVWICPGCNKPDDGSPMIGCDKCDDWFHWPCVGIKSDPLPDVDWYCPRCQKRIGQLPSSSSSKATCRKRSSSSASPTPPAKKSTNKSSKANIPTMKAATKCPPIASAPKRGRPPKVATVSKRQRKVSSTSTDVTEEDNDDQRSLVDASEASSETESSASSTPDPLTACLPRKTARKSTFVPSPKGKRGRKKGNI